MSQPGHKLKKLGAQSRKAKKVRLSEERRSGSLMNLYFKRPSNEEKCVENTLESENSFQQQNVDKVEETSSNTATNVSIVYENSMINSECNDQTILEDEYAFKDKRCSFRYTEKHKQLEEGGSNSYRLDRSYDECDYNPSDQSAFYDLGDNSDAEEHKMAPREEARHTALAP